MGFFNWFSSWPKRLPEGYVKTINIKDLIVFVCGENHPQLEGSRKYGGTMQYNNVVWLQGWENEDGSITVKLDKVISHEFRRVLHNNDPEMVNANMNEEI